VLNFDGGVGVRGFGAAAAGYGLKERFAATQEHK
jgi:hypothetical protein